jgi:regulator of sirC expression with transglutaminase-like and TPR domain
VPAPAKVIVWRMLNNVKRSWLERTQGERAARAVDLLLQLHPDHPGELRARATILSALGYRAALADVSGASSCHPTRRTRRSWS